MTERTAYLIAAGLFALAAGVQVGSGAGLGLVALVLLAPAVLLGWLGVRQRRVEPN